MKDYNIGLEILKKKIENILNQYINKRNTIEIRNKINSQLSKLLCDFNNNRI